MNYTSATGSSVHQTVSLIMVAIHAEQRKLISEVMAQNTKLVAILSKGGGGNGGNNSNQHKTPWKEKKLCPNFNKEVVHDPADYFSLEANKNKHPKRWGTKRGNRQGPGSQDNDETLREWISKNTPPHSSMLTPVHNYWTPLASQVEELDNPPPALNHLLSIRQTPPHQHVTFTLSPHHVDKDSTIWRRGRPPGERTTYCINPLAAQHNMRMGVLNGTIPSAVSDTGATSSAFPKEDPSIPTGRVSSAIFHLPNGALAPATTLTKLLHNVQAPAQDVNIVPSLVENSLLSTSTIQRE
jgi:hypothetical protein